MAFTHHSSETFARIIEHRVSSARMNYMEAIMEFCEQRHLDPEMVVPLLNDKIKMALASEAQRLHLIPKMDELPFE